MKPQEAIRIMKIALAEVEWEYPMDYAVAFEEAIKALEKQIPETPDYEGDGYADGFLVYDTWICPSCGRYYELDCSDDYIYCPQCGQLLDWSTLER